MAKTHANIRLTLLSATTPWHTFTHITVFTHFANNVLFFTLCQQCVVFYTLCQQCVVFYTLCQQCVVFYTLCQQCVVWGKKTGKKTLEAQETSSRGTQLRRNTTPDLLWFFSCAWEALTACAHSWFLYHHIISYHWRNLLPLIFIDSFFENCFQQQWILGQSLHWFHKKITQFQSLAFWTIFTPLYMCRENIRHSLNNENITVTITSWKLPPHSRRTSTYDLNSSSSDCFCLKYFVQLDSSMQYLRYGSNCVSN